ncbi:diacylglycerol kinase [Pseudorhodoplanes sp.]|uniref:diacylglycerol kinase n=1 Tax=Pseudorhodoplanes sp. TaxID=1934341 RepID=UPI002C39BDFB|nr:diacylglycerol kinase [Pseudorhodoplanes sp.]HWV41077.1 diacylglycerol kinase [Pseudorhodoplanes sp.]
MQRIWRATLNTMNGLRAATASEAAFQQELFALVLAVPLAVFVASSLWMALALIAAVLAVMIAELLNTAIEKLADRITLEHDPVIGRVKDMGSAAVGLTLLVAGAVWLLAIFERVAELLR